MLHLPLPETDGLRRGGRRERTVGERWAGTYDGVDVCLVAEVGEDVGGSLDEVVREAVESPRVEL